MVLHVMRCQGSQICDLFLSIAGMLIPLLSP